ncbi:MAG: hypothetical protein AABZ30_07875 [Myxococcota bacterium]
MTSRFALVMTVGCGPAVPESPAYYDDVRPILLANCVRCHGPGTPGHRRARGAWRADTWDAAQGLAGVSEVAPAITGVAGIEGRMPKEPGPLPDFQRDLLLAWADAGWPRGDRFRNEAPVFEFLFPAAVEQVTEADATLEVEYLLTDDDGDACFAKIGVEGQSDEATAELGGGRKTTPIDTSVLATGAYRLVATARDGLTTVEGIPSGPFRVPARNAAPRVRWVSPQGPAVLRTGDSIEIAWEASDADGDAVDVRVEAIGVGAAVALPPVQGPWTIAGLSAGSGWSFRVTASDGELERADESDRTFVVLE